jgi:hypothetical protein
MKTFEEKYTVWLDGGLDKEEAAKFESEFAPITHDKIDFLKLKTLLQENIQGVPLDNPDFFNSQIMAIVDRETTPKKTILKRSFFRLPRIAWSGTFALVAGVVLFFTLIPRGDLSNPRSGYVAQVLKTRTVDPKVHATVDSQKDMTIIRLEGLDKVPTDKEMNQ